MTIIIKKAAGCGGNAALKHANYTSNFIPTNQMGQGEINHLPLSQVKLDKPAQNVSTITKESITDSIVKATPKKHLVENELLTNIVKVLKALLPNGIFTDSDFRIGNVYGNNGNSLSVCLKGANKGLWTDFSTNQSGNLLGLIAAHNDLDFKSDIKKILAKAQAILDGLDGFEKTAILQYVGLDPDPEPKVLTQTAEWDYLNPDGTYCCTVVRYEQPNGKKTIRPYNKLTKSFGAPPDPRPLYNLPGIAKSDIVYLVEGEKCAQALIDAGYCATTSMMGANAPTSKTNYSSLKDKSVFILRDNDIPGISYAKSNAKAVIAAGAKCCTRIGIPEGKPEGWDIADALAENPSLDIPSIITSWGIEAENYCEVVGSGSNKLSDFKPMQSLITVEELNKSYAVVFMSGQSFVLKEFINEKGRQDITLCRLSELKLKFANQRVVITDLLGKLHDVCIIDAWMKDDKRRSYDGIVFAPQGTNSVFYNLFRGFPIEAVEGDCSLYLQHLLENICRGNNEFYDYLISWMAHMIQRPWELPGVAIVFRGAQGTGKGVATDELGKLVEPHYIALSGMEQLVGRFTGHLKDMLLVYANEATWGGNKSAEGALKAMITDQNSSIEQKFKDVIRLDNFKRIMISSNEDWAVPVGKDDRRFFILDVSNKRKEDHAYFGAIIDQMRNGGTEALMYLLTKRDLSEFNVRKIPQSPFNFDLKLLSMDSTDIFIYEYLREATEDEWDSSVSKSSLHKKYLEWCKEHGKKHSTTASVFGKILKRTLPTLTECKKKVETYGGYPAKRENHYIFSSLKICRIEFEKSCKSDSEIWKL